MFVHNKPKMVVIEQFAWFISWTSLFTVPNVFQKNTGILWTAVKNATQETHKAHVHFLQIYPEEQDVQIIVVNSITGPSMLFCYYSIGLCTFVALKLYAIKCKIRVFIFIYGERHKYKQMVCMYIFVILN